MNAANILVVDDEPQIRRVMRATLSSQGYVISEAKTGEEALDSFRKLRPDLVLLDVVLPGQDGLSFLKWMRDQDFFEVRKLTDAL